MLKLSKTLAVIAGVIIASQACTVHAQSETKRVAQPQAAEASATMMSKAFTNGYNVPSTGVALEGYCPVCYIAAGQAAKGNPEFSHEHNGITYWFVSDAVRQTFVANPEKFLPAYGGWCAFGVATGQRFPVDPTNFKVVNGRIMLFLKNEGVDGAALWNENEAANLQKADANWVRIKG